MNGTLITSDADGIFHVMLDRPHKYNAVSDEMLQELHEAVTRFAARRDFCVMLIRGASKYFSASVQISPDICPDVGGSTLDGRAWHRTKCHFLFDELEAIEKPIVAVHQGPCLGGGLEISLSCNFRLAATSARYGLQELEIGALPCSGGVSPLTRIAGPHWARWLVMAGEQISGDQAPTLGIVPAVYPDDELASWVRAFCLKLAQRSYELLGLAKLSIELAADLDHAQARNVERISNSIRFTGSEHKAPVQAFLQMPGRHTQGPRVGGQLTMLSAGKHLPSSSVPPLFEESP